jgi:hypothetical protein
MILLFSALLLSYCHKKQENLFASLRETFWLRPSALVHLTLEFSRVIPSVSEESAVGKIGGKRRHSAKKAVFAGMAPS